MAKRAHTAAHQNGDNKISDKARELLELFFALAAGMQMGMTDEQLAQTGVELVIVHLVRDCAQAAGLLR